MPSMIVKYVVIFVLYLLILHVGNEKRAIENNFKLRNSSVYYDFTIGTTAGNLYQI